MENFLQFFDNSIAASQAPELSGDYGRKANKKKQILEALRLWKGIQNLPGIISQYHSEKGHDADLAVLSCLRVHQALLQRSLWLNHKNPYVRVVARVEQFPDKVFRHMLWFHSIDFWSCEAFLRRLSHDDILDINTVYDSLFGKNPHLPVCMTEGLANKLRHHFGEKETVEGLLSQAVNLQKRYKKAPAFSINLFGMDFGRARYDDAVNDFECPADLLAQFHGGAWVVNKECGKYDWLFRKIRHNAWWDIGDEEVREGKHFCPGVYTTLMLLAFVFYSPLSLAEFLFAVLSPDSFGFWGSVEGLLGLPALLVLLRAAWRGCLEALTSPWGQCSTWWNDVVWSRVKEKHEFDEEFWEKTREYAITAFASVVLCVVFGVLTTLLYYMSNGSILFGLVSAAFLVGYWLFGIITGEDGMMNWVWPTKVPYVGKPACVILPLWLLWLDKEILLSFILQNLAPILLWGIFAAYAWACVVVPKKFDEWIEDSDPRGEKIDRASGIFQTILGFMATTVLVFALWVIYLIASGESLWLFLPMLATFVFAGVTALMFSIKRNPEKTYWEKSAVIKVKHLFVWDISCFASNAWVRSLNDPTEVFQKIYLLWSEWPDGLSRESFYSRVACVLNADLYALVDGYIEGLPLASRGKKVYCSYFFKGVSFKEATRLVEEEERKWKKIKEGLYWVYYYVLFGWLFGWIGSAFAWLCEMASHAYVLVEIFNTECPLVEPLDQVEKIR